MDLTESQSNKMTSENVSQNISKSKKTTSLSLRPIAPKIIPPTAISIENQNLLSKVELVTETDVTPRPLRFILPKKTPEEENAQNLPRIPTSPPSINQTGNAEDTLIPVSSIQPLVRKMLWELPLLLELKS